MNIIYTDIILDFAVNKTLLSIPIKQNDVGGRVLRIALTYNGQPITISSGNGDAALLYASTGSTATAIGTVLTITDNRIIVPITSDLSAIAGVERCEVRIYNTYGFVHTSTFYLNVGKASADSSMPSVIATADIIERIDTIEAQIGKCVRNMIELEHFRDTRILINTQADSDTSSLMDNPPKITVSSTDYNPARDWLFMFKNNNEFIAKNAYTIDTETVVDGVRILFDTSKISFQIGDTLDVLIFKSHQPDLFQCTESEYEDIDNPDVNTVYVLTEDSENDTE